MTQTRGTVISDQYPPMTYEEYLNAPEIPEHTEWVNGRVIPMMSVSKKHAELTTYLIQLIGVYAKANEIGGVYADPFNMKLGGSLAGRAPDVLFVRTDRLALVREQFLDGPADLVVEVISPGTERIDRRVKFAEYQAGGVPEYWILDPHREVAEFYVRDEGGIYQPGIVTAEGEFTSTVVAGLRIQVVWLWELPRIDRVLLELGLGR